MPDKLVSLTHPRTKMLWVSYHAQMLGSTRTLFGDISMPAFTEALSVGELEQVRARIAADLFVRQGNTWSVVILSWRLMEG